MGARRGWLGVAVLALATIAGCGGRAPAVRHPDDERLGSIRIEGNHAIETDTLLAGLALHGDQAAQLGVDPYQLGVDTARIRTAYLERGFFDVDVRARLARSGDAQVVIFTIVEGPRATTALAITGLPPDVGEDQVRAIVALRDGAPFDYEAYDDAKEPLIALLEDAGYAHVRLDARVIADRVHARATVRLAFEPGPRCRFGDVTILGVDGVLAGAIRARLAFEPGDRYAASSLLDSERAIFGLGRFSSVRVEPDRSRPDVIPVRVTVARATRHELVLGGGVGYEPLTWDLRLRGGLTVIDPMPLWTLTIDARPALSFPHDGTQVPDLANPQLKLRAAVTLQRIDLVRPGVTGELEPGYDYVTVEAYTSRGPRLRLGVSSPLGVPWLQLRVGWQLESLHYQDPKVDDATQQELGIDHDQRLGAYEQALIADLRDDPIQPHRGIYVELHASEGTRYAGGQLESLILTPEARGFVPLGGRAVLALRARTGLILGGVPATERFFAGGASSQRGFSERHLSPAVMGIPIGGAGMIEAGAEVRVPFATVWGLPLSGVVFLDGGDVTRTVSALDPLHLHWAIGPGLRAEIIKSLTFRFDVGYRLNRTGPDEPEPDDGVLASFAFHIGVGQAY
jgi:outer membrane protein insertion porin family